MPEYTTTLDPNLEQLEAQATAKNTMVIIPTYNEVGNIERLLEALFSLRIEGLQILIVDDNSPDGTGELVKKLAHEKYAGHLEILERSGKLGLGTAYIAGFELALKNKNVGYIVQMDADFSHDPNVIKRFREVIEHADVALGSRYILGGSLDRRWKLLRRLISRGGSIYSRAILGLKVHDTTSGFKMFRREVLEKLPLERVRSNGYCFQIEMIYLCEKYGFRIEEVPIHFNDRVIGVSKMSPAIAIEAAWKVWQVRFRY